MPLILLQRHLIIPQFLHVALQCLNLSPQRRHNLTLTSAPFFRAGRCRLLPPLLLLQSPLQVREPPPISDILRRNQHLAKERHWLVTLKLTRCDTERELVARKYGVAEIKRVSFYELGTGGVERRG